MARRLARRLLPALLGLAAAGCGGGVAIGIGASFGDDDWPDYPDRPPQTVSEPGLFLIAGDLCPTCLPTSVDGRGSAARFNGPEGIAADGAGNVYVAERGSNTIRKVTRDGVATTLAGTAGQEGSADGFGAAARFRGPTHIAVDGAGTLFVADSGNSTIRRISASGQVSTLAGQPGTCGSADGTGAEARFCNPQGIVLDRYGNLLVADKGNHTIRLIDPQGRVSTVAGRSGVCGAADGNTAVAQFCEPGGVAADGWDNYYVTDTRNFTVRMIKKGVVSTLAGLAGQCGTANGRGGGARFCSPSGIVSDTQGNLYVADTASSTIRWINIDNEVRTIAGVPGQRGNVLGPLPGGLDNPGGIAILDRDALAVTSRDLVLKLVPLR